MKTHKIGILFLSLGCALLLLGLFAFVPNTVKAQAARPALTTLGGLDLNRYCLSIGYTRVSLDGGTAYDWHCVSQNGSHVGFSMTSACRWQYNDNRAEDVVRNFYNPYTWQCFTNANVLGGLDLNGYCLSIGYTRVSLDGGTAYDWHCVSQNGSHVGFSMTSACQWQYSRSAIIDRFTNFYSPYTWQCWG